MSKTKKEIALLYPKDILLHFENEIKQAGSFEELLLEKKAVQSKNGLNAIVPYPDIEKYKEIFLSGKYQSICHLYDTEIPYIFWSKLYEELQTWRAKQ